MWRHHRVVVPIGVLALIAAGALLLYRMIAPPLTAPTDIAKQVGAVYGERHPRVVTVVSTQTDNTPHEPMYAITLAGRFHEGHQDARYLSFSALADRTYVWAIQAYDTPGNALWLDADLSYVPH